MKRMTYGMASAAMALAIAFGATASIADEVKQDQVVVLSDETMDGITAGANIWDLFKNVDLQEWTKDVPAGAKVYLSVLKSGAWTQVHVTTNR